MRERILQLKKEGKIYPIALNLAIGVLALLGVLLACVYATRDGYSTWLRRMLYFTQQSNLWIAAVSFAFVWVLLRPEVNERHLRMVGLFKYIFTVSITVTGIIFCALLAPFADIPMWYLSNVITHVIVPVLAILDFFTDRWILPIRKREAVYGLIPPAVWFVFASVLCLLRVDFGRGDPYPYFFMNFYSEAGLFGAQMIPGERPQLGSFYWFVLILLVVLGLCYAFYALHAAIWHRREEAERNEKAVCSEEKNDEAL